MVKDMSTGDCYRADHLLADHVERLLADKDCPPDKAREYQEVFNQVLCDSSGTCICYHVIMILIKLN